MVAVRERRIRTLRWQTNGFGTSSAAITNPERVFGTTAPGSLSGEIPTSFVGENALEGDGTLVGLEAWTNGGGATRTHVWDRLWVSGGFSTTAATPVVINSLTLPTRANGGEGCTAYALCPSTTATGPLTVSYTNSSGVSGRTGNVPTPGAYACAYMELQAGDTGVRSIESVTNAVTSASVIQMGIFRRLGVFDVDDLLNKASRDDSIELRLPVDTVLMVSPNAYAGAGRYGIYAAHVAMD